MITSLKNNNNLLRKHIPIFRKRSYYGNLKRRYSHYKNTSVVSRTLTKEELAIIKAKTASDLKKEFVIRLIKRVLFWTLLLLIVFVVYRNTLHESTYRNKHPGIEMFSRTAPINPAAANSSYLENMELGIKKMQENKWFYASGYFEVALSIRPNDKDAEYQLALAYCLLCYNENKACRHAEEIVNHFLKSGQNTAAINQLKTRYLGKNN